MCLEGLYSCLLVVAIVNMAVQNQGSLNGNGHFDFLNVLNREGQ